MNCSKEKNICVENREIERDVKLPLRVIIEGPQGSGKSSLSKHLSTILGCEISRGFPTGEFIKNAKSQLDICAKSFELVSSNINLDTTVFDRSPFSQFVWEARTGNNLESCLLCSKYALEVIAKNGPVVLAFIDCNPEICMARQDSSTSLSVDREALESEVLIYRLMRSYLEQFQIQNVQIVSITNDVNLQFDEFLSFGQETILSIINKQND